MFSKSILFLHIFGIPILCVFDALGVSTISFLDCKLDMGCITNGYDTIQTPKTDTGYPRTCFPVYQKRGYPKIGGSKNAISGGYPKKGSKNAKKGVPGGTPPKIAKKCPRGGFLPVSLGAGGGGTPQGGSKMGHFSCFWGVPPRTPKWGPKTGNIGIEVPRTRQRRMVIGVILTI